MNSTYDVAENYQFHTREIKTIIFHTDMKTVTPSKNQRTESGTSIASIILAGGSNDECPYAQ